MSDPLFIGAWYAGQYIIGHSHTGLKKKGKFEIFLNLLFPFKVIFFGKSGISLKKNQIKSNQISPGRKFIYICLLCVENSILKRKSVVLLLLLCMSYLDDPALGSKMVSPRDFWLNCMFFKSEIWEDRICFFVFFPQNFRWLWWWWWWHRQEIQPWQWQPQQKRPQKNDHNKGKNHRVN